MGFFDAISSIGEGLAQTAAQAISDKTGINVGSTLTALFGGGQTQGGQNMQSLETTVASSGLPPAAISQLQTSLETQGQLVADLGGTVASISGTLASFKESFDHIESELSAIHQQQLFLAWQTPNTANNQFVVAANTAYQTYSNFLADYTNTPTSEVTGFLNNLDGLNSPANIVQQIQENIVGQDQQKGLLQLWSAMVTPLIANYTIDFRDAVQQYMRYYQQLVYAQLSATNLEMEAATFGGDGDRAARAWTRYQQAVASQENVFIGSLIALVAAGTNALAGPTGPYNLSDALQWQADLQLNPGLITLPADPAASSAYFEPSPIFRNAEALLASLAVTDPPAQRVVVYVTYVDGVIASIVNPVALTLSSNGQPPLTASSAAILGPFTDYSDYNFEDSAVGVGDWAFWVKRFVYTGDALQSGTYTVTNINGVNGLIPMETYASTGDAGALGPDGAGGVGGPVAFMNGNVWKYQLSVDPTSPFDFMNFMAYCTPYLPN
ncbi:MAG TPA: hypothetical protein VIW45_14405 [Vicinamibacterales bacterium]